MSSLSQYTPCLESHKPGPGATAITVAFGDGIGPEIMQASLKILIAAGARLAFETIDIGERVYLAGNTAGIAPEARDSLRRTKVSTRRRSRRRRGGGFKSLNVTVRKTLGPYANVRPCAAYAPFVATKHPHMNLVIVRENEEDLYAGIEHRQTDEVVQCLKIISRPGCERIVRYAFECGRARPSWRLCVWAARSGCGRSGRLGRGSRTIVRARKEAGHSISASVRGSEKSSAHRGRRA